MRYRASRLFGFSESGLVQFGSIKSQPTAGNAPVLYQQCLHCQVWLAEVFNPLRPKQAAHVSNIQNPMLTIFFITAWHLQSL